MSPLSCSSASPFAIIHLGWHLASLFMEAEIGGKFNNISMSVAGSPDPSSRVFISSLLDPSCHSFNHSQCLSVHVFVSVCPFVLVSSLSFCGGTRTAPALSCACLSQAAILTTGNAKITYTQNSRAEREGLSRERKRHNRNKLMRKIEIKFSPQNAIQNWLPKQDHKPLGQWTLLWVKR